MEASSLHQKDSHETFVSLLQLDPTPIEATLEPEKELPPLPDDDTTAKVERGSARPAGTTSTLGLSGGGHGSVYYCKSPESALARVQRYSTYAMSIFTSIHLANSSLIPLFTRSVPASESYLLLAREIYQTSLTEPLLVVLPILAHITSGVALRLVRRHQNMRRYGGATPGMLALHHSRTAGSSSRISTARLKIWPSMTYISISGYGFAVFLLAHVLLNRCLPLAVEGDSADIGLAYVSHGFARHGFLSWVSYIGLLSLGCSHMVWGMAKWLGLAQRAGWRTDLKSLQVTGNPVMDKKIRKRRRRIWLGVHGASLALTLLWAAGGLGVVARGGPVQGWVGKLYDETFSRVGL